MKLLKILMNQKIMKEYSEFKKKIFKGLNKNNEELKEVIKGSNDNCFIF